MYHVEHDACDKGINDTSLIHELKLLTLGIGRCLMAHLCVSLWSLIC